MIDGMAVTFEVKFARINIANRYLGSTGKKNWAFVNMKQSPGKTPKQYDILIAIGLLTLGLEDDKYWSDLKQIHENLRAEGRVEKLGALPHESEFLSICSFFVMPMNVMPANACRINLDSVEKRQFAKYRAWGYDEARCKAVWNAALDGHAA